MHYMDSMGGIMLAGGFSADLMHHAFHTLGSRVLGFTQELFDDSSAASMTPEVQELMIRQMSQEFPNITAILKQVAHDEASVVGSGCDDQFEFEFAIDVILDGLEALRQREAASARDAPTRLSNRGESSDPQSAMGPPASASDGARRPRSDRSPVDRIDRRLGRLRLLRHTPARRCSATASWRYPAAAATRWRTLCRPAVRATPASRTAKSPAGSRRRRFAERQFLLRQVAIYQELAASG